MLQRFTQELDRDVDGQVAGGKGAGMEQPTGLLATAAAQVDQREIGAQRLADGRHVHAEDRRLGAGRVVLRQFGNRLEQA